MKRGLTRSDINAQKPADTRVCIVGVDGFVKRPLQLWVMENSMEVVARQLLLLYVSLSPPESVGMQGECGAVLPDTFMPYPK